MYRLLIVDDNNRDRRIVKEIVDWHELGVEIAGEAVDGREALAMVEELNPHIVLSDIAMPVMNGIKLAGRLKERNPEIRVIFMSCHDDFAYVRSAIDLDIHGYVLKPVIPKDLKQAVQRVLNLLALEKANNEEKGEMLRRIEQSLPAFQEEFFRELIYGSRQDDNEITKRAEFLHLNLLDHGSIRVITVEINEYERYMSGKGVMDKYLTGFSLRKIMNSLTDDDRKIFFMQNSQQLFVAVVFCRPGAGNNADDCILNIAVDLHTAILEKAALRTTIGISEPAGSIADIPELFRQSIKAIKTRFYSAGNPIIFHRDIDEEQYDALEEKVNLEQLRQEVKDAAFMGGDREIGELIAKYTSGGCHQSENCLKSLAFTIVNILHLELIQAGQSMEDVLQDEFSVWKKMNGFPTVDELRQWLYQTMAAANEYFQKRYKTRDAQIVTDIKEIIHKRFQEQLTINDIAQVIYLGPKQANNIFKRETNQTIFDYLLDYRMAVAKKMLSDPYSKIYLVAQEVGYINKSHFCLMFKKHTGLTPNQYKNMPTLR